MKMYNINISKKAKNDEFYTIIEDIAKEIVYYVPLLKNKIIYCNCDNENSNFWKFFMYNFNHLQLKKLIATSYNSKEISYKLEYDGKNMVKTPLQQNGDFRSPECIDLLKESDIVITNPPFSLFREYISQLIEYEKKFLIIGNQLGLSYSNIFPLIIENKIWLGVNYIINFTNPEGKLKPITTLWYTNLEHKIQPKELNLYKKYNPKKYPTYDNYKAININKIEDIPKDYYKAMGVPITFLKYNTKQFKIIGIATDNRNNTSLFIKAIPTYVDKKHKTCIGLVLNKKAIFARIIIKRRV